MAERNKKTQAERAASGKGKNSDKKANTSSGKQKQSQQQLSAVKEKKIPSRLISSLVFLGLSVLFLVIFLNPEGALVGLLSNVIHGLIGSVGFYISIPVLFYLFIIHAFSKKRPVLMRTICLISFALVCGCIAHLVLNPQSLPSGVALIGELYIGGSTGTSGGVICGLISIFLLWIAGPWIPYIIFILGAVVLLLAGMDITVLSIINAVQNRPRADWEDSEPERADPATVVVNHIAAKRIQHLENKRQAALIRQEAEAKTLAEPKKTSQMTEKERVEDMFRQIDGEIETPVSAAGTTVPDVTEEAPSRRVVQKTTTDEVRVAEPQPNQMPPLEIESVADTPHEIPQAIVASVKKEKVSAKDSQQSAAEVAMQIAEAENELKPAYCFPPIDLLKNSSGSSGDGTAEMRENTKRLNETLESFKIDAHIVNVTRGPSVTRYEVELEKGVRLNKLTSAADDIALSLGATGVRIAAIPGKISVVGIEVPNRAVTTVSLREVIDSQEFNRAKSKSSFSVGKDIGGNCIVGNISKLPHMLIAGTTGSGKSVCMNSIIISLLYKASPDDVKLIMVDPKMVELGIYNGIPHLLIPVVTDPKKAAGSLQWAVSEMMRRYATMRDAGVRDLESYNSIIQTQEEGGKRLPQVVVIIDELADLMLVAAKEVEESICRIAQMGRAAGIHLIIATQRPSADVITGLMKANIPSRIAFAVASAMESRIILDTQGAEKLVGKGDMLYAPIGIGKPKRVQGCFVSDSEVEAVTTYVKTNFNTDYDAEVLEQIEKNAIQTGKNQPAPEATEEELDGDEMLPAAVDVILETGQASVSMLQRRLKLGYARAARIVDEMEEKGIVGPFVGSKPRAILITKEAWQAMRNGQVEQLGFDDIDDNSDEDFE